VQNCLSDAHTHPTCILVGKLTLPNDILVRGDSKGKGIASAISPLVASQLLQAAQAFARVKLFKLCPFLFTSHFTTNFSE
jgi:hypothetical protein